jgi:copper(I)-binding protein
MIRQFFTTALAAAAIALAPSVVSAHEFKAGALEIGHPWSRATAPGAQIAGGYLTVTNTGTEADRLVSVTVPFAAKAEIHESTVQDGVAKMRPLADGVAIAAGAKVDIAPGGVHLMFVGLKQPLKQGQKVDGTLTFEKAGTVNVQFAVEPAGFTPNGMKADESHKGH